MKKWIIVLFMVSITGLIFWSCSGDDSGTEPDPDTTNPTISITAPADSTEFDEGDLITIKADATDNEDVVKVEFYINSNLESTDEESPYEYIWDSTDKVGTHTVMAKTYDPSDNIGISSAIIIKINPENHTPQINSLTAEPASVQQNGASVITCNATDMDGDALTYLWEVTDGVITGTGSSVTWTAPNTIGTDTITCIISDGQLTDTEIKIITVTEIPNNAPVINSLTANPISVEQGSTSTLTCIATDIDGDTLEYSWSATGGTISGISSSETWTAPTTIGDYTITCIVSDGVDPDIETKIISVTEIPNNPPIISSITASPISVEQGDTSTLTCTATDIDGDTLEYSWSATGGTISGTSSSETWTAPTTIGDYTITCIVSDGTDTDIETKIISVTERPNNPPIISSITANPTSVEQGGPSTLTCTATDADGDVLTYSWLATGGSISGISSSETWTAPTISGTYTIICIVSDGSDTDTATKSITCLGNGMIFVQGGTFEMGDNFDEGDSNELPVHSVTVSDFILGNTEVTQAEWAQYMPTDTYDHGAGDTYPVYRESWYEIIKYCNLRSMDEGLMPCYTINSSTDPTDWGSVPTSSDSAWDATICNWSVNGYRLPTEAEWEYAARGGIHNTDNYHYSGSNTVDDVAWYLDNSNSTVHLVGTKAPNQLGIYDMSGNIWEWCWDWHDSYTSNIVTNPTGPTSGIGRIWRGGTWGNNGLYCRVSTRWADEPFTTLGNGAPGFRFARSK